MFVSILVLLLVQTSTFFCSQRQLPRKVPVGNRLPPLNNISESTRTKSQLLPDTSADAHSRLFSSPPALSAFAAPKSSTLSSTPFSWQNERQNIYNYLKHDCQANIPLVNQFLQNIENGMPGSIPPLSLPHAKRMKMYLGMFMRAWTLSQLPLCVTDMIANLEREEQAAQSQFKLKLKSQMNQTDSGTLMTPEWSGHDHDREQSESETPIHITDHRKDTEIYTSTELQSTETVQYEPDEQDSSNTVVDEEVEEKKAPQLFTPEADAELISLIHGNIWDEEVDTKSKSKFRLEPVSPMRDYSHSQRASSVNDEFNRMVDRNNRAVSADMFGSASKAKAKVKDGVFNLPPYASILPKPVQPRLRRRSELFPKEGIKAPTMLPPLRDNKNDSTVGDISSFEQFKALQSSNSQQRGSSNSRVKHDTSVDNSRFTTPEQELQELLNPTVEISKSKSKSKPRSRFDIDSIESQTSSSSSSKRQSDSSDSSKPSIGTQSVQTRALYGLPRLPMLNLNSNPDTHSNSHATPSSNDESRQSDDSEYQRVRDRSWRSSSNSLILASIDSNDPQFSARNQSQFWEFEEDYILHQLKYYQNGFNYQPYISQWWQDRNSHWKENIFTFHLMTTPREDRMLAYKEDFGLWLKKKYKAFWESEEENTFPKLIDRIQQQQADILKNRLHLSGSSNRHDTDDDDDSDIDIDVMSNLLPTQQRRCFQFWRKVDLTPELIKRWWNEKKSDFIADGNNKKLIYMNLESRLDTYLTNIRLWFQSSRKSRLATALAQSREIPLMSISAQSGEQLLNSVTTDSLDLGSETSHSRNRVSQSEVLQSVASTSEWSHVSLGDATELNLSATGQLSSTTDSIGGRSESSRAVQRRNAYVTSNETTIGLPTFPKLDIQEKDDKQEEQVEEDDDDDEKH